MLYTHQCPLWKGDAEPAGDTSNVTAAMLTFYIHTSVLSGGEAKDVLELLVPSVEAG
jgi:hypothetical protein